MVCRSVCWSTVNPAKMAKLIEILFGLWAQVVSRNRALDGVEIHPWEGAILGERGGPLKNIGTLCCEPCKGG